MNIVIAIPCLNRGGTEMQTLHLVRVLLAAKYSVTTLCYFEYDQEVVNEYSQSGSVVELLNLDRNISKLRLIVLLRRKIINLNPDVVHVQYIAPTALVILAARLAGKAKVLATVHQLASPYGWKQRVLMYVSRLMCKRITFVSLASQESWFRTRHLYNTEVPESFYNRTGTIYNSIDTIEIQKILDQTDSSSIKQSFGLENKFIIGVVSRLNNEKGIDLLFKAFVILFNEYPKAILLIVGDGPERSNLEFYAKQNGFIDRIISPGNLSHTQALQMMSIMDIVVIPSRFEGFGLTAIEALSMGKIVVASKIGGLVEISPENKNFKLIQGNTEQNIINDLSKQIVNAITDYSSARKSSNQVNIKFAFENYKETILQLYKSF